MIVKRKKREHGNHTGMLVSDSENEIYVVGEWPGSGQRTLTNLHTGTNMRVSVEEIRSNFKIVQGTLEVFNAN